MSFWLKTPPVLDADKNVLRGGMWPHQLSWWESEEFFRVLVTGYGGGKTLIGAKWAISCALQNAPVPHLIISPSYKIAKRTIVPTLKSLLAGKERLLKGFRWRFLKTDHEFQIYYHGRQGIIWVASGDDPLSLRGPNVGSGLIDEPFIQSRDVFDQLIARVREPAPASAIGLTGTPEELNWGYDICEGEEAENFELSLVQASTRDNKVLTETYTDRLEATLTEEAAKAYVDGAFISLAVGKIYYGFSDANVISLPVPEEAELGVGMDFNVDPMAAVVFYKYKNCIHVIKEYELANADTEYMCSVLREDYGQKIRTVYPDATGRSRHTNSPGGRTDFHHIRDAGYAIDVGSTNPKLRDRYNTVNGALKPKDGAPRLTIDPGCKRLIAYLKQISHSNQKRNEHMTHLLDALGYPVCRLFPIKIHTSVGRLHGA